jgi:hypothetical protein
MTFFMSPGARNWPFLMFTGLPLLRHGADEVGLPAQEGGRLQHVAPPRPAAICDSSCTSVSTGTPSSRFTLARISSPRSMPGPRKLLPLLRLALS